MSLSNWRWLIGWLESTSGPQASYLQLDIHKQTSIYIERFPCPFSLLIAMIRKILIANAKLGSKAKLKQCKHIVRTVLSLFQDLKACCEVIVMQRCRARTDILQWFMMASNGSICRIQLYLHCWPCSLHIGHKLSHQKQVSPRVTKGWRDFADSAHFGGLNIAEDESLMKRSVSTMIQPWFIASISLQREWGQAHFITYSGSAQWLLDWVREKSYAFQS